MHTRAVVLTQRRHGRCITFRGHLWCGFLATCFLLHPSGRRFAGTLAFACGFPLPLGRGCGRVLPAVGALGDVNAADLVGDVTSTAIDESYGRLRALGTALWEAGDCMLTAGSFLGDAGWANRGENPAVLGYVGTHVRNAADCLLAEDPDWYGAEGELTEAAAGGDFYFTDSHFEDLGELIMSDEGLLGDPGGTDDSEVPAEWPVSRVALQSLAAEVASVAESVRSDGVSSAALDKASARLAEAAEFFGASASESAAAVAAANDVEARVEAELANAGETRAAALERLSQWYHPIQNPGREHMVLPSYHYVMKRIELERDGRVDLSKGSSKADISAMVEAELACAADSRSAALRKLLLRYHPDQNPGREEEVLPVFLHVQQLRDDAENAGS